MTLERNTLLHNRYRILDILGEGGMGAVYKARDENLGVVMAVKENLYATEEYARQFRIEASILASLRHPNLTRVTDHFEEGEGQYLVMDYIEGEDLRDRMDRLGVIEEDEIITIGLAICEALSYLHTRIPPILHRDIKPGNVRIAPNGQVYLVDFGLAKIVEGSQLTLTGARAMTPGYSPPEQYGTARTDARSDIYSLGATLYSAVTGNLPEDALARAMSQATLTPVRKLNPKVSRKLANTIEKALEIHPKERFQSAEEFQKALLNCRGAPRRRSNQEPLTVVPPPRAILDDVMAFPALEPAEITLPPPPGYTPPDQSPPPPAEINPSEISPHASLARPSLPISKPVTRPVSEEIFESLSKSEPKKRKPLGCLPVILLILLLIGGSSALAYLFFPSQFNDALTYFVSPSGAGATSTLTASPAEVTALPSPIPHATLTGTSPPAVQTASTRTSPPSPTPTPSPTRTPTPTASPTATTIPAPTPFGGSGVIIFASTVGARAIPQLFTIHPDGTNLQQLTDIPEGACQPDWSTDDRIVFVSPCPGEREEYPGSSLWLINADGSGLTRLTEVPGGDWDPDWSPDATQIVFSSIRSGKVQVYLLTLADGSTTVLADQGFKNMHPSFSPDGSKIVFISLRRGPFQIWMMNRDGSEQTLFSRSGDLINIWPVFTPDGQWIVYTQREVGKFVRIAAASLINGEKEFVIRDNVLPRRAAAVSPDGQWVAFESWPEGENHDIYVMSFDGQQQFQVTSSPSFDFDPDWQPAP